MPVLTVSWTPIIESVALSVRALPVALALAHLVPPLARAFAGMLALTTMGSVEARPEARAHIGPAGMLLRGVYEFRGEPWWLDRGLASSPGSGTWVGSTARAGGYDPEWALVRPQAESLDSSNSGFLFITVC